MKIARNPKPKQFERRVAGKFAFIPVAAVKSNTGGQSHGGKIHLSSEIDNDNLYC